MYVTFTFPAWLLARFSAETRASPPFWTATWSPAHRLCRARTGRCVQLRVWLARLAVARVWRI
jgi:hypothetical protein